MNREQGGRDARDERETHAGHGAREGHGERGERGKHGGRGERPARGERSRVLGRGELPLVILALLDEAPRHGYDVIRSIEERCRGAYAPSAGVIYPTLTMLEDQDLALSAPASDSGKRQYRITDAGRRHAADNAGLIRGAFARMDTVARMRARETLPARVKQAMETLKQALMASGVQDDGAESERIAQAIESAARAIVAGPAASPTGPEDVRTHAAPVSTSPLSQASSMTEPDYASRRVRHETTRRTLHVVRTERMARDLIRVTLGGEALRGFVSAAFDDHIKVFLPRPGETVPTLPSAPGDDAAPRPIARDYTPRRYDPVRQELDIEFVVHGDGPGSRWAERAAPGDPLVIGGPKGSFVLSDRYDWYLLIGDATALPAIGRRIEELPEQARALVFVALDAPDCLPVWPTRPNVQLHPVFGAVKATDAADAADVTAGLLAAVQQTAFPAGTGHAWVAAESASAKALHAHLVDARGFDKRHVRASSYWRAGASGHHEKLGE